MSDKNIRESNFLSPSLMDRLSRGVSVDSFTFSGQYDTKHMTLEPQVTGYSFFMWLDLPDWFKHDDMLMNFKEFTQKNFFSFQGLSDMTLEMQQTQMGFVQGNVMNTVGGISKGNTNFSLEHKEYVGSIVRKMYQQWISMVRDSRTGVALYPHAYRNFYTDQDRLEHLQYSSKNHSGRLLYVVTRPDIITKEDTDSTIEFATIYSNVMPTLIPFTQYTYTQGSQESPMLSVEFTGVMETGPIVEKFAKQKLDEYLIMGQHKDAGFRIIDSFDVLNPGTFKQIVEGEKTLQK